MAGFLHRCASYVMRGRQQAIIIALLFTMLPLLGWISNVIIALVTLRKGVKEGAIVLLWVILPVVVIAALANPWIALYNIVGGSLFGFLLAVILRQTQSWQKVLEAGMLLGLLAVLVVHLIRPDINAVWLAQLGHYAVLLKNQLNFSVNTEQLQFFTKFATGFQVAFLWLGVLINLMLARGLQSMLYNPGRLSPELEAVRLSKWDGLVLVLIVIASLQKIAVAQDALPVVLLTFLLAGLSVLHAVIRLRNGFFKGWFLVFYSLLVVFFPYIAALLVLVALADSYLDFRHRVLPKH
ncbi:hypothetical membrane spanning protein [Candidatus Rickettsiella viridis]|uniref:Hypothetical membrane spanning protein n=1 Tax=Candidatus Rickettsiella viridis TaxID=676208 RepID=A0A2Z5UTX3_9COXI|nr:hypothetical protein [Candidatus Rickettsiella viridis]BBB14959.1 hypothetical membrane spanning protein [Candidatus Rickettsiella viridis]